MLDPVCAPETAITTQSLALGNAAAPAESSAVHPRTVSHPRNYTWAELMKRVWALDVLGCPRCLNRMRILAAIHPPDTTRRILDCVGLPRGHRPLLRPPPCILLNRTGSKHRFKAG